MGGEKTVGLPWSRYYEWNLEYVKETSAAAIAVAFLLLVEMSDCRSPTGILMSPE